MFNKKVFIINGSGGVGKDTFVNLCAIAAKNTLNMNVLNYSSVDEVKQIAKKIGWKGTKTERDRKFLSDLKVLCTDYNDMPFNAMRDEYELFTYNKSAIILFLHIREPQEIERAKKQFDAKTVLVIRNSVSQIVSNMADKNVYDYDYDITIDNSGSIEQLNVLAYKFIADFVKDQLKKNYSAV